MTDNTGRKLDQKAELDGAYISNGVSKYSRAVAASRQRARTNSASDLSTRDLIDMEERRLRELYRRHRDEGPTMDPERLEHLRRDIDAKQNFVAALWARLGMGT